MHGVRPCASPIGIARCAPARERPDRRSASGHEPPRRGRRHRRGGAGDRAARLSALARQLPLAVRAPRRQAARSASIRRPSTSRPRSTTASPARPHRARLHRGRGKGERDAVLCRVRVRRHDAGEIAALGRAVRARGDAGVRQCTRRCRRQPAGRCRATPWARDGATFNRRRRAKAPRAPANPAPWPRPSSCAASARS